MDFTAALGWTFLNIITAIILGFYSMQEMACMSFNKIRLQYYVSKGMKRALWLDYLLSHPTRLFATTLISVNVAMFIGSECARQTYLSLGLSPDLAPLTQVAFVIIFAELAPMFAARRYAEHVALMGAPILYFTAKIMTPLLWSIGMISKLTDWMIGSRRLHEHAHLNQEDLQKILALQFEDYEEEGGGLSGGDEFSAISRNIFSLRNKDAWNIMEPIKTAPTLPSNATVAQARAMFHNTNLQNIAIYHRDLSHIVGIIHPRDILRTPDSRRVREYANSPWFITQNTQLLQILREFRHNNRKDGIVLNAQGLAIGMITLDDVTEEIFGKLASEKEENLIAPVQPLFMIDRTFPAEMTVGEFNGQFHVKLDEDYDLTLGELMQKTLGHPPEVGEMIYIAPFELTVKETTLMEVKKIAVSSRIR